MEFLCHFLAIIYFEHPSYVQKMYNLLCSNPSNKIQKTPKFCLLEWPLSGISLRANLCFCQSDILVQDYTLVVSNSKKDFILFFARGRYIQLLVEAVISCIPEFLHQKWFQFNCMWFPMLNEIAEMSFVSIRTILKHNLGDINAMRLETNINFCL